MAGAWLRHGHVVGAGIRRIGYDVSDLAPEDRRDGAALFNLAARGLRRHLRLVGVRGWFPDLVYGVVNGTFGWMSLLLPLVLFVCAFRLFRQPDDGRGNNRIGIGFLIMTFAGAAWPTQSAGSRSSLTASTGCARPAACSASRPPRLPPSTPRPAGDPWPAGLRVPTLTATPFGAIPGRLRGGYEHLMGIDLQDQLRPTATATTAATSTKTTPPAPRRSAAASSART